MSDPNPTVDPLPEILYQDDWIIAVNKPAGLLVHPSWIAPAKTPNLVSLLRAYFPCEKIHTVHRLDRATSGVILFARSKEVAHALQTAFSERQVEKRYLCVTRGWTEEQGVIDYPLKPIHDRIADAHSDPDKPAQEAVSSYRRLGCVELPIPIGRYPVARYSLVEVCPKTGRKHQIRRHMKHIFHPLVGDTKHGEGRHNRLFREHLGVHRLLLMATDISFNHPVTDEVIKVVAPVSDEVDRLFSRFGWSGLYPTCRNSDGGGINFA
ncbi:tRNA pseudouridine(65) synthase TruC [Marinobacterium zhoushanense]|uniref:tRNA pseudouridine synthase C n=1 Tax=Marinobacterium zhoushanense TaxID=1679163 RepID=A0ABQ1KFH7_9GAMM|nr:pseudouridine synthase [Marinobacterium zhoushanense]GGB92811.1 tRNA pseudouridine(65) synthase TruC [Marinobacterium zhoushanense]